MPKKQVLSILIVTDDVDILTVSVSHLDNTFDDTVATMVKTSTEKTEMPKVEV